MKNSVTWKKKTKISCFLPVKTKENMLYTSYIKSWETLVFETGSARDKKIRLVGRTFNCSLLKIFCMAVSRATLDSQSSKAGGVIRQVPVVQGNLL